VNEFITSKRAVYAARFFARSLYMTHCKHMRHFYFHSSSTSISMRIFSMERAFFQRATDARRRSAANKLRILFSCQEQKVVIFASLRPHLRQKLLKQGENTHFYPWQPLIRGV